MESGRYNMWENPREGAEATPAGVLATQCLHLIPQPQLWLQSAAEASLGCFPLTSDQPDEETSPSPKHVLGGPTAKLLLEQLPLPHCPLSTIAVHGKHLYFKTQLKGPGLRAASETPAQSCSPPDPALAPLLLRPLSPLSKGHAGPPALPQPQPLRHSKTGHSGARVDPPQPGPSA